MSIAFVTFTCGTMLNANQNTGMRKKENGKRSNCIVERCSIVWGEDKQQARCFCYLYSRNRQMLLKIKKQDIALLKKIHPCFRFGGKPLLMQLITAMPQNLILETRGRFLALEKKHSCYFTLR